MVYISDLDINDIAETKRLGERRPGENRLILVRLKSEEVAQRFHNFGCGRHLGKFQGNDVWVNQDLTRTERTARFQMRQERKAKQEAVRVAERAGGTGDAEGTGGARRGNRGTLVADGDQSPADRQRRSSNRD